MIKKRILSVGAFFLAMLMPLNALAAGAPKDEIVYISTSQSGDATGIYVVNIFDLESDMEVVDYGKYSSIKNLSSFEALNTEGGKNSINAPKGKFFYQGDNPEKELPWNISIEYYLEGKKISPDELVGKSGNVELRVKINPNSKADKTFTDYYLGQLSLEFDSNYVLVKDAPESTLAYQGSIQILNYAILPGKTLDISVKLDSKSFEMLPFKFSAVPFNMNFDMPDTSKLTDSLKELEDGIAKLSDGSSKLAEGIGLLSSNSTRLLDGLYMLNSGALLAKNGQLELIDGTKQFHNGLEQYQVGIDTLVNQIGDMGSGLGELKLGLIKLKDGSSQLTSGLKEYQKGIVQYTDGVTQIASGQSELTSGIETIVSEGSQLKSGGKELVLGSTQIYEGLAFLDQFAFVKDITKEEMEILGKIIEETLKFWNDAEAWADTNDFDTHFANVVLAKDRIYQSIVDLESQLANLDSNAILERLGITDPNDENVQKLLAEFEKVKEGLSKTKSELERINSILEIFISNYNSYEELVEAIKVKRAEINQRLLPLKNALAQYDADKTLELLNQLAGFRSSYKEFHDGLVKYTSGTNQLLDGIENELLPGSKQILEGLNSLEKGGKELTNNIPFLVVGSERIYDAITLIVEKLDFEDINQVVKLKNGIDLLVSNHSKILNGQSELYNGLTQISNGLGEYISGFGQFDDGVSSVASGMNELNNGTSQLAAGTAGMSDKAKEEIDEAMKAFNKEGFELKSFVDDRNTNIKLVQFVYISDSLKVKTDNTSEIVEVNKTFWEKIIDIIIFWD